MKRDARIGLAVVLVLGLGVTLLIGKAIYKRGGSSAELEGELADAGSSEIGARINFPETAQIQTQPAQISDVPPRPDRIETGGEGICALPAAHPGANEPSESATKFFSYTVVNGDSPWIISSKVFGDGKYTQKIVDANNLKLQKMKPGMTLKIPAIAKFQMTLQPYEPGRREAAGPSPAPAHAGAPAHTSVPSATAANVYKIQSGDTLAVIAKKHYGSSGPKTIQLIVAANRGLDPGRLKVGHEINLPPAK